MRIDLDLVAVPFAGFYWDKVAAFNPRHTPARMADPDDPGRDIAIVGLINDEIARMKEEEARRGFGGVGAGQEVSGAGRRRGGGTRASDRPPPPRRHASVLLERILEAVDFSRQGRHRLTGTVAARPRAGQGCRPPAPAAAASSSSMTAARRSNETAPPPSERPFTNSAGVPDTPAAVPARRSARTAA